MSNEILIRQIALDRALAAQVLFPHRHPQHTPPFHITITDLWRSAEERIVVEAFREGAKTTLAEEFLLIEALFQNFSYLLIIGETYTKACQRIEAFKHELLSNQKIIQLFGTQKGPIWSENKIVLKNGVAIEAHGWEEEHRGYKHLDKRPDRAYLDDIETRERVRDKKTVDQNWKRLHMELLPAMDTVKGKVWMTGTPLADDCMLRRAAASSEWVYGKFPILQDDEAPAWPERYPVEWITAKREHYEAEGLLAEFNQEYMLIASGAVGKPFTDECIHIVDAIPKTFHPKVIILDPARTTDLTKSDQTGRIVASRMGTKIYIHESGGEYWQPDKIVEEAFALSHKYNEAQVFIEKNSLDDWLMQPIRYMMLKTGTSINIEPINAPQDRNKDQFIMGLQPFFTAGDIILVGGREKHSQLISQILNFPSGKKDILNALAYVLRVFTGEPIYEDFSESNINHHTRVSRTATLLLGVNTSATHTSAVLCALEGQHLTVLTDWASPLIPSEAMPEIAAFVRAVHPGPPPTVWVTGDVFDQQGRNPLIAAIKSQGWKANRSEYASHSRGNLSTLIRTEIRGHKLLRVDANCFNTINALASTYTKEKSSALIEALEAIAFALTKPEKHDNVLPNCTNASGQSYFSALRPR